MSHSAYPLHCRVIKGLSIIRMMLRFVTQYLAIRCSNSFTFRPCLGGMTFLARLIPRGYVALLLISSADCSARNNPHT